MTDDSPEWDYSRIPPRAWEWQVDRYTDYTVRLLHRGHADSPGLHYTVDDFTGLHGAGFQTFSRFLAEGPMRHGPGHDMPSSVAAAIREHLLEHRRPGGARLAIVLETRQPHPPLERIDLQLDDTPVGTVWLTHAPAGAGRREVLVETPVSSGEEHAVSWDVFFLGCGGDARGTSVAGRCRFATERRKKHTLRLRARAGTITAYWGGRRLETSGAWRYDEEIGLVDYPEANPFDDRVSLDLRTIHENRRVYSPDGSRVAAFYVARIEERPAQTATEYEIKAWDAATGKELLREVRRYVLDHATNRRDGMPLRSVAFSDDGRWLVVTRSLRGTDPAAEATGTERIRVPRP